MQILNFSLELESTFVYYRYKYIFGKQINNGNIIQSSILDKGNPWSRGLPEKLTGCQIVKTSPALYRTRRFITAFRINTVLLSTHRFSKCSLSLTSCHQNPVCTSPLSRTCYIPLQIYSSLCDHRSNIR